MRRFLALNLCLGIASVALAQETLVSDHPQGTVGNWSAYRYDYSPNVCPPYTDEAPISLAETRTKLCELVESPLLSKQVEEWVNLALAGSGGLNKQDVFVTFIELCRESGGPPHFGHFQGDDMQYAGGLSKVFYATSLFNSLQANKIKPTQALTDDIARMLHDADNEATNRLVDYMTATKSGPPVGYPEFCNFAKKRDYTNWYFVNVGFENFNVNQKLWTSSPSPRDLQLLGEKMPINFENSNRVTSNQAAALMYLIDIEAIVSRCASKTMKSYMYRPLEQQKVRPLQGIAAGLPVGSKLISMNAYTSRNYHDVGIVTLPNHKHYVLSVFSKYSSYPTNFVPLLSKIVAKRQMTRTGDDEANDYLTARPLAGD